MKSKERNIKKAQKICDLYATGKHTIENCCESEGVPFRTFHSWSYNNSYGYIAEIEELYKKADETRREMRRKNLEERKMTIGEKALAALERKIEGWKWDDVTKEGKNVKVVTKFQIPDTAAIIFAATNAFPDVWKNRQNTDVTTNGKEITEIKIEVVKPK